MNSSPNLKRRQEMFKQKGLESPFNSPSNKQTLPLMNDSPTWRNAFKKRCFDEFKKSRQKLMNKFRDLQVINYKMQSFFFPCILFIIYIYILHR